MHRLFSSLLVFVSLIGLTACTNSSPSGPTETELAAVADTVLALETAFHRDFDNIDCTAALAPVGDREPVVVGGGTVVRTLPELRSLCEAIASNRSKAVLDVENIAVHALSPSTAYVVREGDYTVYNKEGAVSEEYFIIFTTIWQMEDDRWTMAHLHESWREPDPATP